MTSTEIDTLVQEVHNLRTVMIDVGTGKRRIDDAEAEYTQLRSHVAAKLRRCGVADPNRYVSLWDWYSHWKESGLSSYQSRRDFINTLYKPVVNALEAQSETETKSGLMPEGFSARLGYTRVRSEPAIQVRRAPSRARQEPP